MKTWELRRGNELLATLSAHHVEPGKSGFLAMLRDEKNTLIGTIYLATNIGLHERPAEDKSSPAKK